MSMQLNEQAFAAAFAQAFNAGMKGDIDWGQKAPTGTVTGNWIHGPGGILGSCAIDSQVISARITPRGLSRVLPARPAVDTNPMYPFITGIESSGDAEPTTECATCPSGITESCMQTAVFGYVCRESKELTPNRAIERVNRGEVDLQLLNDILGLAPPDVFAAIQNYDLNTVLQIATAAAMLEVGALFQNKLVPMTWQGNPANNIGTGYKEFPGLDLLISQNYVDAETGATCEALDSDVKDFNYGLVDSLDANGNFRIVYWLEYMEAYCFHNAERMGLEPVTWKIAMRPELWYELTNIWPIAYLTLRGGIMPAGSTLNLDATRIRDMANDMRRGQYIWLNGRQTGVVLDDGILELHNGIDANVPVGQFASSIYLLPITATGNNIPVLYYETKDYRKIAPEQAAAHFMQEFWTDDGRFLWTNERLKWCYTLSAKTEPRILLKTPMLAGRLNHVMYQPLQHFRSFDEDSDYFLKGGVEERPAPSLYSQWNLPSGYQAR